MNDPEKIEKLKQGIKDNLKILGNLNLTNYAMKESNQSKLNKVYNSLDELLKI